MSLGGSMIIFLGFTVSILVTIGQLLLQAGSQSIDFSSPIQIMYSFFTNKIFYLVFVCYFVAGIIYLYGLKTYGLNKFFFFLAVSYISVPLVNSLINNGNVTIKLAATSILVFSGLMLAVFTE